MGFHNTPSNRNFILIIITFLIIIGLIIVVLIRQTEIIDNQNEQLEETYNSQANEDIRFYPVIKDITIEDGGVNA